MWWLQGQHQACFADMWQQLREAVERTLSGALNVTIAIVRIDSFEEQKQRTHVRVEVTNQDEVLVAVADHLLQWVENT